jgi:hypothetical protein
MPRTGAANNLVSRPGEKDARRRLNICAAHAGLLAIDVPRTMVIPLLGRFGFCQMSDHGQACHRWRHRDNAQPKRVFPPDAAANSTRTSESQGDGALHGPPMTSFKRTACESRSIAGYPCKQCCATARITMDTYVHLMKESQKTTADVIFARPAIPLWPRRQKRTDAGASNTAPPSPALALTLKLVKRAVSSAG